MNILYEKVREMLFAVAPVTFIMLVLHFTVAPIENYLIAKFLIGGLLVIIGLALFLFGVELGIEPIGSNIGKEIVKSKKTYIFVLAGFILGFFITVAEPDILIFADNVSSSTNGMFGRWQMILSISLGIGVMLSVGLMRILYDIKLNYILLIMYAVVLVVAIIAPLDVLGISFDAAGATTGSMTVPFMLALGAGVSSMKIDSSSKEEDSFGLTGVSSGGPILSVLVMAIFFKGNQSGEVTSSLLEEVDKSVISPFIHEIPHAAYEVVMSLLPIVIIFIVLQYTTMKLKKYEFNRIMKGTIYTFIGLVLFLTGVNTGFSEAGTMMGQTLVTSGNTWLILPISFILGLCIIFAEPAVHVLGDQVEDVTGSHIKKSLVLATMSIGVAIAIVLAMLKILVPAIQLWHYLLFGYFIALTLMAFIPKIFVGIAFDSGGVASGPMSVTFILAFAQGVASSTSNSISALDGFGTIAIIALAPIITMEILGLIYKIKLRRGRK